MWWMTRAWRELLYPGLAKDFFELREMPVIDPASEAFHLGNALSCAELSRLVYRHDLEEDSVPPVPSRREFLLKGGFEQLAFFQDVFTHTQAMLVRHLESGLRVLVFRGTEQDIRDFITDCDVGNFVTSLGGGKEPTVHRGFVRALDSLWSSIVQELSRQEGPVWVTGHSLGAALATLACCRFSFSACYTFGSPRVGDQVFADCFPQMPLFRVVDDEDLVCKVPIEAMGFVNVGETHHLQGKPRRWGWRNFMDPIKPLEDHTPKLYVQRLR